MTILDKLKECRIQIFLFLFITIAFILVTGGNFWEYDSFSSYKLSKSIVDNGNFQINCFWGVKGGDGFCYSKYGIFMSIVIIPFYLIEKFVLEIVKNRFFFPGFFPSLTNCFVTAGLSVLFFNFAGKLGFSKKMSFAGTLLFSFATFLPAYTKTLFGEPLLTFLIYLCLHVLIFYKSTKQKYLFAGIIFGLGFLSKITMLTIIPVIFYLFLIDIKEWRKILFFFLPVLISIMIWGLYNDLRFGNVLNSGYRGIGFGENLFEGLFIFILSPGKSIFLYQPFIIFFIFGFWKFFRNNKKVFIAFFSIIVISFIFYAIYSFRTGEWTWGARFLYTTLPFFVICVMFFLKSLKNKLVKFIFYIFIAISLMIQFSSVYISYHRYYSFMAKSRTTNFFHPVFYDPYYSPIVGQWKMIFRQGYKEKEKFAWREAFQEYAKFDENYKISSPDLFFARSRILIFVFVGAIVIEFYLLKRIYDNL